MADSDEFRDYLQRTGCEKALLDILIELDKMKIKPNDPVEYIREHLDPDLTEKLDSLKIDIATAMDELSKISSEYPVEFQKFLKIKKREKKKGATRFKGYDFLSKIEEVPIELIIPKKELTSEANTHSSDADRNLVADGDSVAVKTDLKTPKSRLSISKNGKEVIKDISASISDEKPIESTHFNSMLSKQISPEHMAYGENPKIEEENSKATGLDDRESKSPESRDEHEITGFGEEKQANAEITKDITSKEDFSEKKLYDEEIDLMANKSEVKWWGKMCCSKH